MDIILMLPFYFLVVSWIERGNFKILDGYYFDATLNINKLIFIYKGFQNPRWILF